MLAPSHRSEHMSPIVIPSEVPRGLVFPRKVRARGTESRDLLFALTFVMKL